MRTVTLHDGREAANDSEDWRHECEARSIMNTPTLEGRRERLRLVEKNRGAAERKRLERTMVALWQQRKAAA